MNTVKPLRAEDLPVCTQTRDAEHCGEAYALVNFIPSRASRSMFGICRTGIREFGIASSIATGDPFHAQSSINSKTIFGFSAATHVPASNHLTINGTNVRVIPAETARQLRKVRCINSSSFVLFDRFGLLDRKIPARQNRSTWKVLVHAEICVKKVGIPKLKRGTLQ